MALTLAVVEALVLFAAACGVLLARQPTLLASAPWLVTAQALTFTLCGLFAFHFNDFYDLRRVRSFGQFAARLPQALVLMVLLVGAAQLLVPSPWIGWRPVAEAVVAVAVLVLPLRATLHHLFAVHPFSRRVLVVGSTALAGKLVGEILAEPDLRDVVVGVVDDRSAEFKPSLPSLCLGPIENLANILQGFEPDLIVTALPERHDPLLLRPLLAARARGIPVEDGLLTYERLTGKVAIEHATPRALLFSKHFGASWLTLFLARALSAVVAACAIVVLSPFIVPVALLIKLDSDGPVFFLHERVGLGGRPFKLVKFRTMRMGVAVSEWAADNDHRTTRVGFWLRRFRIDELPQFLNILQGDMNLVGPRPHPVSNFALFTQNIPFYGVRCSVRPGVTGWAQIRYGYANNLQEEIEKMRYDLHYLREMSLRFDLRILFETMKVVVRGGRLATLEDEPATLLSPIYFGLEHPRHPRRAMRGPEPLGQRDASSPTAATAPFDDPTKGSRAPSRGAA
jgi:exopolysaccharide biosynthesis polyprenyl glycosylphosphotransferase